MPIKLSNNKIITPGTPNIPTTNAVIILIGIDIPSEPPNLFNSHKITIPKMILIINSINLLTFTCNKNLAIKRTTMAVIIIVK